MVGGRCGRGGNVRCDNQILINKLQRKKGWRPFLTGCNLNRYSRRGGGAFMGEDRMAMRW
jgi:hypothetical protein